MNATFLLLLCCHPVSVEKDDDIESSFVVNFPLGKGDHWSLTVVGKLLTEFSRVLL